MNFYPNNNNYFSNYPVYPQNNNPLSILQGKIVENQEIVKTTEIPFNSFGVFPKGDFSEIYIKTWNNNGTTRIMTYKPVGEEMKNKEVDTNAILLEKLEAIEKKLNEIQLPQPQPKTQISDKKKEAILNAY